MFQIRFLFCCSVAVDLLEYRPDQFARKVRSAKDALTTNNTLRIGCTVMKAHEHLVAKAVENKRLMTISKAQLPTMLATR